MQRARFLAASIFPNSVSQTVGHDTLVWVVKSVHLQPSFKKKKKRHRIEQKVSLFTPCSRGTYCFMELFVLNVCVGMNTHMWIFPHIFVGCILKVWNLLFCNKPHCTFIHLFNKYLVKAPREARVELGGDVGGGGVRGSYTQEMLLEMSFERWVGIKRSQIKAIT